MDKFVILEKVKAIVANQLEVDPSEVTLNTNFPEVVKPDYNPGNSWWSMLSSSSGYSGGSLDTVEIIMAIEEEFDIEIPDEDAENIRTVQQAVNYISQKLAV